MVHLGESLPQTTLMFAKLSPNASKVGYVSELNIYVETLPDQSILPITTVGGGAITNGTFDWVYEEKENLALETDFVGVPMRKTLPIGNRTPKG